MNRIHHRMLAGILGFALASALQVAAASTLRAFSAELDATWNYGQPDASERRFRAELVRWAATEPQALIITTQIARAQGLRRQFDAAHATLDSVKPALDEGPAHVRIRYLLERGRVFNSSGSPGTSLPLFSAALALAEGGHDEFYAVDAAHMLGIAAPPDDRLRWNLKALALAEAAMDSRARGWRGSLHNNIGWIYHERGQYAEALRHFEQALLEREARGNPASIREARWAVARAHRSLGRASEAEAIQQALVKALADAGETDGYVFEELAELAAARNDTVAARSWATKAHAALATDPWFRANEGKRLDRLAELAGEAP